MTSIEDLLAEATSAVDRSTAQVTHDRPVKPSPRRSLATVAVVVVLGLFAGLGALAVSRLGGGESNDVAIATDGDTDNDDAVGDEDDAGADSDDASANTAQTDDGAGNDGAGAATSAPVPPMVTDAPPDGFTFDRINTASEMGEPTALLATQVYGVPGQPGPLDGDEQLTVNWSQGEAAPPMSGDPIPLRGDGFRRGDGAVGFEEDGIAVWVRSTTLDEAALVDLAEAVVVTAEGPEPIVGAPGGLDYLGAIHSVLYNGPGSSVPPDGHSTDYSGGNRTLSIMSEPAESGTDVLLRWTANAEVVELGGHEVVLVEAPEFISAVWVDGNILLRALGNVTRDELDAVIATIRPANEAELAGDVIGDDDTSITPPDGPSGDTAALGSAPRVATSAVPDGLTIQASGDHADLGDPLFTSERHLYGPDDGGASIVFAFGPPTHPFPGETVEIEGVDVVIVDKQAANTGTDLNFTFDGLGVTLRGAGAGADPDGLLDAAADYIRAGGVDGLAVLSNGYRHRAMEETQLWEVGSTNLNGPGSGTSIVYGTADELDRRLHITSTPVAAGGDVGWYAWLYPDETEIVSIAGIEAELARPDDDWWVARFLSGDRVIELRGTLLSREEMLAAAAALRPAIDAEWNVGVG